MIYKTKNFTTFVTKTPDVDEHVATTYSVFEVEPIHRDTAVTHLGALYKALTFLSKES